MSSEKERNNEEFGLIMYSFHHFHPKCKDMLHLLINASRFKSTSVGKEEEKKKTT